MLCERYLSLRIRLDFFLALIYEILFAIRNQININFFENFFKTLIFDKKQPIEFMCVYKISKRSKSEENRFQ